MLLNESHSGYALAWTFGIISYSLLYMNIIFGLCRAGHELESAKSKVSSFPNSTDTFTKPPQTKTL